MAKIKKFEDIESWKKARELAKLNETVVTYFIFPLFSACSEAAIHEITFVSVISCDFVDRL